MSENGKRLRSARVVKTMTTLHRFISEDLAIALDIAPDNARRWVAEYSKEELLVPVGTLKTNKTGGVRPTVWEWRG